MAKFNLKRFTKYLTGIFFPPFSELELLALFYLLLLTGYRFREAILEITLEFVSYQMKSTDFQVLLGGISLLVILLYTFYRLGSLGMTQKPMSQEEKRYFTNYYYLLISAFTFYSVCGELLDFRLEKFFFNLNNLILYFVLLRSIFTFVITFLTYGWAHRSTSRFAQKLNNFYYSRVLTVQANKLQIVLLLFFGVVFFNFWVSSYSVAKTIILSYFYTTTILQLFNSYKGKLLFSNNRE